jgi:TatD DNase family protein
VQSLPKIEPKHWENKPHEISKMPFLDFHTHRNLSNTSEVLAVKNVSQNDFSTFVPVTNALYSFGLHPWYLTKENAASDIAQLEKIISQQLPYLIGIGECGLDKLRGENLDFQRQILEQQIQLAHDFHLPVIIHCVRAYEVLLQVRKKFDPNIPFIVHGFNQNPQILKALLQQNFYISIGAAVLQDISNAAKIIAQIPLNRLFLETDAASLDISIEDIYQAASSRLGVDMEVLKSQLVDNFTKCTGKFI